MFCYTTAACDDLAAVANTMSYTATANSDDSVGLISGGIVELLRRAAAMGCVCAREKVTVEGETFTIREQIAEG